MMAWSRARMAVRALSSPNSTDDLSKTGDWGVFRYLGTWSAATWAVRFYERHGFRRVSVAEKKRLLRTYWSIPARQVETSVVLAVTPGGLVPLFAHVTGDIFPVLVPATDSAGRPVSRSAARAALN